MNEFNLIISYSDIAGYIGLLFFVFSFQAQTVRKTSLMQSPADLSYSAHFFMLGSAVGGFTCLAASLRDLVMALAPRRVLGYALGIYVILIWSIAFFTFQSWVSFLPAWGTSLACFSMYFTNRFILSRIIVYLVQILWLLFFVSLGSLPGIINGVLMIGSNTIGLVRHIIARSSSEPQNPLAAM